MPKYEEPELQNKSVRAQIHSSVVSKLRLFWPFRSEKLGFVLIIFDPTTGETIMTTRGNPEHVVTATEQVARDLAMNANQILKAAGNIG